jgi:hypothetical protein
MNWTKCGDNVKKESYRQLAIKRICKYKSWNENTTTFEQMQSVPVWAQENNSSFDH